MNTPSRHPSLPPLLTILRGNTALQVCLTLLLSATGAMLAMFAQLPAASLIGSTLIVSLASICRIPAYIPALLRNMAFAIIGCSLGSGLNGSLLEMAQKWPVTLLGLVAVIGCVMFVSTSILTRFFGQSRETAFLSSSPGAMTFSLAIAAEGVGDGTAVVVLQSIRLLFITAGLPLVLELLNLQHGAGAGSAVTASIPVSGTLALFLMTLGAGYVLTKRNIPAAYLIAGVVISGALHMSGTVSGRPQPLFLLVGFMVTGAVVGARFTRIPLADIRRLIAAALVSMLAATFVSALFAAAMSQLLSVPFGQLWIAYAPGGVEAMSAMALALDYDTGFVAAHHLFRIVLLLFALPVLLRLYTGKRVSRNSGK